MNHKRFTNTLFSVARVITAFGVMLQMLFSVIPAQAATVTSAGLTGGTGTYSVDGTIYARNGGALTLTVHTTDTKCVKVTGAFSAESSFNSPKDSWTFSFTAGIGDDQQTINVTAYQNKNCSQRVASTTTSFILDNTAPALTATVSPAPNAAGWNNSDVTINWTGSDTGSGVASGPTPSSYIQSTNTDASGVTVIATATDNLGNTASSPVTVKLDKSLPTITGSRSPAANTDGWNNTDVTASFSCSDSPSGIKSCSGPTTLSDSAANQAVTGNAVDNADNSASATVSGINIDKDAPTLSGSPTTGPDGDNGWYKSNVTVKWTASDELSGLVEPLIPDSTISGEGENLTASLTVNDKAGNSKTATSPAVKIDKTAPVTTANAPTNWNNVSVDISLDSKDALSGVAATYYVLDGGGQQSGNSLTISTEGDHALDFWSVDNAGNVEAKNTVHVKIDLTKPTINHTLDPKPNANSWNNSAVTVTFTCVDTLSGIASCTGPHTVNTEGEKQEVTGEAVDKAGNSATDPATVSIDWTPPTISVALDRSPDKNNWYNKDVKVTFTCDDAISGIDVCPNEKTLSEGANQTASGTAFDAAGNSATASVEGINIDETAPTLVGTPSDTGWVNHDVTVTWSCEDALSGMDGNCPKNSVVEGEGNNLSIGASVSDLAGNVKTTTVSGIQIDRTVPVTTTTVPEGWSSVDVTVEFGATDALSGVAATYYKLDGGETQSGIGVTISSDGDHTLEFWSVDKAGNVETAQTVHVKVDKTQPKITGSFTPAPNSKGWNNGPVTVEFKCEDSISGIRSCPGSTLLEEGAGQSVTGTAVDNAGNEASATVSGINVDLTASVITDLGPTTGPDGTNGWYKSAVTNTFKVADALSGFDGNLKTYEFTKSSDTAEGNAVTVNSGTVADLAGNVAVAIDSLTFKIDLTDPTNVTFVGGPAEGGSYTLGSVPTAPTCTAEDSVSGLASCEVSGYSTAAGTHTMTATAMDNAGRTATSTRSYTVLTWTLKGFYQPVDMNGVFNKVKNGSTVPLKFQIFAGQTELTDVASVQSLTYAQIVCDGSAPSDEIITTATGGTVLRYDATGGQFVYNWKTPSTAGKCYRVTMTTLDGSTLKALFTLK